jgi:quercetin dioxygenase-like cupin family protein
MSIIHIGQLGEAAFVITVFVASLVSGGSAQIPAPAANRLDPKVLAYKLPDQIQWKEDPIGAKMAVLYGDPSKPGLYVVLIKWNPNHMSHPHWHPHDRFITVISGTWWVGTGSKFDPDKTVPLPAGSFVTHYGKQIHYDGAKDSEAVLEIVGDGPATATPTEEK